MFRTKRNKQKAMHKISALVIQQLFLYKAQIYNFTFTFISHFHRKCKNELPKESDKHITTQRLRKQK